MDIDKVYYYETLQPVVRRHGFDPNFVLQDGCVLSPNTLWMRVMSSKPGSFGKRLRNKTTNTLVTTSVVIRLDWWDKKYLKEKGLL